MLDLRRLPKTVDSEVTALEKCGNFKRTNNFLLQAWQAIYRSMLNAFIENKTEQNSMPDLNQVTIDATTDPLLILTLSEMIPEGEEHVDYAKFREFVTRMAALDSTWKFWEQFVFQDCLAYIMLYLGVRCSNWTLRVAALKCMAPLFIAYDRKTYQKLIHTIWQTYRNIQNLYSIVSKRDLQYQFWGKRATA